MNPTDPNVIQNLLKSKKFVFTLLVSCILFVGSKYGLLDQKTLETALTVLWPTYLLSQGIADVGAKKAEGDLKREMALHENKSAENKALFENLTPLFTMLMTEMAKAEEQKGHAIAAAIRDAHQPPSPNNVHVPPV